MWRLILATLMAFGAGCSGKTTGTNRGDPNPNPGGDAGGGNLAPTAVIEPAGPTLVRFGTAQELDGRSSSDPDGTIASYAWALPSGYSAVDLGLTADQLDDEIITFTAPTPVPTPADLIFTLTVTDDGGLTDSVDTTITVVANVPPVAIVDPVGPVDVSRGQVLQVNGGGSYDADGPLTFDWTLPATYVAADFGITAAELDDAGLVLTMPTTPADGLVFTLTVTDNDSATDSATSTVNIVNNPPVVVLLNSEETAQAITVPRGITQYFDFGASYDPDGDDITLTFGGNVSVGGACETDFTVFQFAGTSYVSFEFPETPSPGCDAPFTVTVQADDGAATSALMTVTITAENSPPSVTITGPDTLAPGNSDSLVAVADDPDGSGSMAFAWSVRSASDPSVDCAVEWGATVLDGDTLDVTAPATPSAECEIVVAWLDVTDDQGAVGGNGHVLEATTGTGSGRAFTASDREVGQGGTTWGQAVLNPAAGSSDTVDYTWTIAVISGGCSAGDLTFTPTNETNSWSYGDLEAAPGTTGCVFEATVEADISSGGEVLTTSFRIAVINDAPEITFPGIAEVSPGVFEVTLPPGLTPTIAANISDPNGFTPSIDWTWTVGGADVTCVPGACGGAATGSSDNKPTITFNTTQGAGDGPYTMTVEADDGELTTTVTLTINIDPCLYVSPAGSVSADGTFANPYGSIQVAIDAAIALPDTNICLIEGLFAQDVLVRASGTNTPVISGGYSISDGAPLTSGRRTATTVEVPDADGITFEPGATNRLEYFAVTQAPTLFAGGVAAAVTIVDASPTLSTMAVTGGAGNPAVGVDVFADFADAAPFLDDVHATGSDRSLAVDAYGVRVREMSGDAELLSFEITARSGEGTGAGAAVRLEAGAEATIDQASLSDCINSCELTEVIGVDARGEMSDPVTFVLVDSILAFGNAHVALDVVGVRLSHTAGVTLDNISVSGWVAGRAGIGVADGIVSVDGTTTAGASTGLTIRNSGISGLGTSEFFGCGGARFSVGVLLVGTQDAVLDDNAGTGRFGGSGLVGGAAAYTHDWSTERVPPTVAGLWLLDAGNITVNRSSISAGGLGGNALCPRPSPFPVTNGLLDGMPGDGTESPGRATATLLVDSSYIECGVPAQDGSVGGGTFTWCAAADLQGSGGATLTNNIIATLSANVNIGVRLSGGTSVDLVNNLIDPDFLESFSMPPPPGTILKYGIYGELMGAGALHAYNNIVMVRRDDPFDNPNERLAVRDLVASGDSAIGAFSNNLVYMEGDVLSSTDAPPYVRVVIDGAPPSATDYAANGVNSVVGIGTNGDNFVDDPLLDDPGTPWEKANIRLTGSSPAINAGLDSVAPDHDIDGDARTTAVDIGPDEVLP